MSIEYNIKGECDFCGYPSMLWEYKEGYGDKAQKHRLCRLCSNSLDACNMNPRPGHVSHGPIRMIAWSLHVILEFLAGSRDAKEAWLDQWRKTLPE